MIKKQILKYRSTGFNARIAEIQEEHQQAVTDSDSKIKVTSYENVDLHAQCCSGRSTKMPGQDAGPYCYLMQIKITVKIKVKITSL